MLIGEGRNKRRVGYGWLFVIGLVLAVTLGSALVNVYADPPKYVEDTQYTLKYNGLVWGNPVIVDDTVTLEKLGPFRSDSSVPPYYNPSENETEVLVGNKKFVCRGDNVIQEILAGKMICSPAE